MDENDRIKYNVSKKDKYCFKRESKTYTLKKD